MLLYLVRHGETEFNLERRIQGQLDIALSELGIKQAKAVARALKSIGFDAIYSSDLQRAMQTADQLAKARHTQVINTKLLRERNFGVLQGLTLQEADARFPIADNHWRTNDPAIPIPQGESTLDVINRSTEFLQMLSTNHSDDAIICAVCHTGTLRGILAALTKIPAECSRAFAFSNGGVSVYRLGASPHIRLLNQTHHLQNIEDVEEEQDSVLTCDPN